MRSPFRNPGLISGESIRTAPLLIQNSPLGGCRGYVALSLLRLLAEKHWETLLDLETESNSYQFPLHNESVGKMERRAISVLTDKLSAFA